MKRLLSTTAIVAAALGLGAPAYATAITSNSDILVTLQALDNETATVELGDFIFSPNSVLFSIAVTNTTTMPLASSLMGFNWDVNTTPAVVWAVSNSPVFPYVSEYTRVGADEMTLCYASNGGCYVFGGGGLFDGTSNVSSASLTFVDGATVPSLDFSNFGGEFFPLFPATGTVADCTVNCQFAPAVTDVPEPASLALLAFGLTALGFVRRRARS